MHNKPHTEEAKRKMSEKRRGVPLLRKRRPTKVVDGITFVVPVLVPTIAR